MPQWKDIDIWLRQKRDGDILEMHEIDAIKNSLFNIFTTVPGSRRMLPEFASILYYLLFEPMDETTSMRLREAAFEAIKRWEDRITVKSLSVTPDYDSGQYNLNLLFAIKAADSEVYSFNHILAAK